MDILNGLQYNTPTDPRMGNTTMSSGSATVYMTDDGTINGNGRLDPSFSYFVIVWINSKGNAYPCEGILSNSNKTLTIGANQQGVTTQNFLLNLIGNLASAVTGVTYGSVPNGTVVNYYILGPLMQ